MDLTGKIIAVLEPRGGVSNRTGNNWKSQDFVIEVPGQYPKKCVFTVFRELSALRSWLSGWSQALLPKARPVFWSPFSHRLFCRIHIPGIPSGMCTDRVFFRILSSQSGLRANGRLLSLSALRFREDPAAFPPRLLSVRAHRSLLCVSPGRSSSPDAALSSWRSPV